MVGEIETSCQNERGDQDDLRCPLPYTECGVDTGVFLGFGVLFAIVIAGEFRWKVRCEALEVHALDDDCQEVRPD